MDLLKLTNITDHPDNPDGEGSLAHILEIYGVQVMPGQTIQIDVEMINEKIVSLQADRYICIGGWPDYYKAFRNPPYKPEPASEATNDTKVVEDLAVFQSLQEETPESKVDGLFSFSAKKKSKDK